jgi:hypothetical protein
MAPSGSECVLLRRKSNGRWEVDKYVDGVRLRERVESFEDVNGWLSRQLEAARLRRVHGARPSIRFNEADARFIEEYRHLASIGNTRERPAGF